MGWKVKHLVISEWSSLRKKKKSKCCLRGHPYTVENRYANPSYSPRCKACVKERLALVKAKKNEYTK